MQKATGSNKALIVDILTKAFDDNKSVNYIIKQDERRIERTRELSSYSFEICLRFGEIFISEDKTACALMLFPGTKRTTAFFFKDEPARYFVCQLLSIKPAN
jgi:hypothetical protein